MCGAGGAWVQPALCQPCATCLSGACPGPPATAPLPSAHFWKSLPVESGREDAAPCPVLRWYPDHLLSPNTPLQLGQSQPGLWVPVLPSLSPPRWCGGESWLMPPAHLLQGSRRCQAPARRPPCASTGAKNNQRRQQPWYLQAPPVPPPCQPAGHRSHLLPDVSHQPWGDGWAALGATCGCEEGSCLPPCPPELNRGQDVTVRSGQVFPHSPGPPGL